MASDSGFSTVSLGFFREPFTSCEALRERRERHKTNRRRGAASPKQSVCSMNEDKEEQR
jgi:hypothetical protein